MEENYEFWFFTYATCNLVAYSAERLREALNASLASLSGAMADPALGQIVLIGHSQGGLLAKLAAIEPEDRLWAAVSRQPRDELQLFPASRHLIQRSFFFQPVRGVHRIIFIAMPHGGSTLVGFRITRLFSRLITLPATILEATGEVLAGHADDATAGRSGMGTGSLGSMSPGSHFSAHCVPSRSHPAWPGTQSAPYAAMGRRMRATTAWSALQAPSCRAWSRRESSVPDILPNPTPIRLTRPDESFCSISTRNAAGHCDAPACR
jgi:pimeloyl-ACP methyl ester carboxylesterase